MPDDYTPRMQDTQWPIWEVFLQSKTGSPHEHAGSLHAPDFESALENARDVYLRHGDPQTSIWVVESRYIRTVESEDNPEFFEYTKYNIYRHPQFYDVPRGKRTEIERKAIQNRG
ncbi:MAG TPA: 1,2-phenylacetyl-CoA epoxidase subunit PaaB [Acidobacteriota bacterium]|nr:1,2-phenylacetyl-CoA epoxidase subunit PaaB [Acidobacteriota bacterium]